MSLFQVLFLSFLIQGINIWNVQQLFLVAEVKQKHFCCKFVKTQKPL